MIQTPRLGQIFAHERHKHSDPWNAAPPWAVELGVMLEIVLEQQETIAMATQAQIDKLMADVTALVAAGVAEINAAVAAAQTASPDPAIDALDAKVTAATKALTDAAAALVPPPATP